MFNSMNLRMNNFKLSRCFFHNGSCKPFNFVRNQSKNYSAAAQSSQNPYMEKYAAKIVEVRKISSEGLKQSRKENLSYEVQNNLNAISKEENVLKKDIDKDKKRHLQRKKDLSQIMKLDTVHDKTAEEIESIWKEYHRVKDGVYAVLPAKSFEKMHHNFKQFPVFLFTLPKADGYEFIMCQFLDQSCYFTSLINYQAFKENAPICLTVTYFTEFEETKGIILMRGEYDNSLKAHEAQCLTNQLQLYYGGQDEEKYNLLWKFNKEPQSFRHMDLISNFESSLGNNRK